MSFQCSSLWQEISGYIDYGHRLKTENFEPCSNILVSFVQDGEPESQNHQMYPEVIKCYYP